MTSKPASVTGGFRLDLASAGPEGASRESVEWEPPPGVAGPPPDSSEAPAVPPPTPDGPAGPPAASAAPGPEPAPARGDAPDDAAQLAELRQLLGAGAAEKVDALEARVEDPEWFAERLPEQLPAAFRANPGPVTEALYPILGPAIRRAIQASLQTTVEAINKSVEHSFSRQGLMWRLEAWRTGVSFGEIVLRNSLVYRIEQIFLIHRESGLPLMQVVDPAIAAQDSSLVAGMLTAIQDFVKDSFDVERGEDLDAIQVGGLNVLIEDGPEAVLAAVVRGSPPAELRGRMAETLERLHSGRDLPLLRGFDGDTEPMERFRPRLAELLDSKVEASSSGIPRQVLVFWGFLALFAVVMAVSTWLGYRRWSRFLEVADRVPGVEVLRVDRYRLGPVAAWGLSRWLGKSEVRGFRDPLGDSPRTLAEDAGLDPDEVEMIWKPFLSLEEKIVLRRARDTLEPGEGTSLEFYGGALNAGGYAPKEWREKAKRLALRIPGVTRYTDATTSFRQR